MITITINTDNAAFDDGSDEVTRILGNLADDALYGNLFNGQHILDSNGNTCGLVTIEEEA